MNQKQIFLIALILGLGVIYRVVMTYGGGFIFNMDNSRDMVEVREMVTLKKLRLTGPTTSINGVYDGPAWYYLLAVPFVITGGNPYGSIVMQMVLWVIGGFFLLKLTARYSIIAMVLSGSLWISSNFIFLASIYALNPNPIIFLSPLLIFLLDKYIKTQKIVYALLMWFLTGFFFNLEMNFGVFIPIVIFFSILLSKREILLRKKFWFSILAYIIFLIPQVIFDLRHQFIMSKGMLRFLLETDANSLSITERILKNFDKFFDVFSATLMNRDSLAVVALVLFSFFIIYLFKTKNLFKDNVILFCLLYILMPFLSYIFLPTDVNPWHLGGVIVAGLILFAIVVARIFQSGLLGKIVAFSIFCFTLYNVISNSLLNITEIRFKPDSDPSRYKNEIAAIDFVYKYANGKNFKVYTYLPSVYDYPYQYLFWWYGKKTYGYIPAEYAYWPNIPQYISNKEKFEGNHDNLSSLVFLIKEPDRNYTRSGWEGRMYKLKTIEKQMVGPLEIEIKEDVN